MPANAETPEQIAERIWQTSNEGHHTDFPDFIRWLITREIERERREPDAGEFQKQINEWEKSAEI